MNTAEFNLLRAALGLTQTHCRDLFGHSGDRTIRRWCTGGAPPHPEAVARLRDLDRLLTARALSMAGTIPAEARSVALLYYPDAADAAEALELDGAPQSVAAALHQTLLVRLRAHVIRDGGQVYLVPWNQAEFHAWADKRGVSDTPTIRAAWAASISPDQLQ